MVFFKIIIINNYLIILETDMKERGVMVDQKYDLMAILNKIFCGYDEIVSRDNLAINDLLVGLKGMSPKFNKLANTIDGYKNNIHDQFMKSNDFFNKRNWWYLHSIDIRLAFKIVKEDITEDEFNQYILDYFRDDDQQKLKDIINMWPSFRIEDQLAPIIRQIVSAHFRGEYFLSVATIIPIIERVIRLIHNDKYDNLKTKANPILKDLKQDFSDEKMYYCNFIFIINMFFENGEIENLDGHNRHKIIHGHALDYGKEINSLKFILALDEVLRFGDLIRDVNFDK